MKTDNNDKINLGIFGGSCLGKDIQMKNNIKKIASSIDTEKYQVCFGGGNDGIMAMVPKIFSERLGQV